MPIIATLGALTSKAWGQFKAAVTAAGGRLYFWGSNGNGEFGNNEVSGTYSATPLQVSPDISAPATPTTVVYSQTVLQIRGDGSLWAWGENTEGQYGNSTTVNKSSPVQVGTLTDWRQISIGSMQAAAIKSNGTLWTWGGNFTGALGDGTTIRKSSPVQIGTLTNWASVSAGVDFCIATKTDNSVWAWGFNATGQLGDGTAVNKSSPIQIGTLTNWSKVAAGSAYSLAIKTDNSLWAWGDGTNGILGDGTTLEKRSPVQIGTLTNWSLINAGNAQSAAIKTDGTLWTWGSNASGALGDGTTVAKSSPIQVGTLTNWSKLVINARSTNSCSAIDTSGRLWAWGTNATGRLGDGTTTARSSPVQIGGSRTWNSSSNGAAFAYTEKNGNVYMGATNSNGAIGDSTTVDKSFPVFIGAQGYWGNTLVAGSQGLAITKVDNSLWAWGANTYGQLGNSSTIRASSPVQIGALTNWRSIASGVINTLAIKTNGTLWAWGYGFSGALGLDDPNDKSSPVQVGAQSWWLQVATDGYSSYGIINNGVTSNLLFSWGLNNFGQLGLDDTGIDRSSPTQVSGNNWGSVSAGDGWALALTTPAANSGGGNLYSTGNNDRGQLGLNDRISRQVFTLIDVGGDLWSYASAGGNAGYAIKKDGTLWSWGENQDGVLGNSSTVSRSNPVQVGTLTNWATVVASTQVAAVFATKTDGTLWFWGNNVDGQAGDGIYPTGTKFSSPVQVGTLTTWSSITSGGQAFGGINNNASLYAWGDNSVGNLAQNALTFRNRSSPVQLSSDTWTYANATTNAISAIKPNGSLWVWGNNVNGRLGDGTTVIKLSPVQIGTLTNWSKTYAGSQQMYALKTDGTLWTWGNNTTGQLGVGTTVDRSSPVQIGTLTNWVEVGALTATAFAINSTNQLYAWGRGANGGLGDGTTTNKSSPVQIGTLTNWSKISAGNNFGFAVKTDGTLWSWGNGANGRLGNGSQTSRSSPVQVGTLNNWLDVFSRDSSSFAIKTDGTLWAWGSNTNGQLGDGTTVNKSSPVQIGTLTNWSKGSSSSSGGAVVALKTDGTLWTWGQNTVGQLGDGTSTNSSSPIQIGSATDWTLPLGGLTSGGLKTV